MTDLETMIRDALEFRAEAVPIRQSALIARRRRWAAPLLAAALVIALVAVTLVLVGRNKGTTTPPAASGSASLVGDWWLVTIHDRQGTLALHASPRVDVSFGSDGRMTGSDSVHELDARYRVVANGYVPSDSSVTGNGLAGRVSDTLKRTLFAIGNCFSSPGAGDKQSPGAQIPATVHGDRLTLHTSGGVLTFVRAHHA